MARIIGNAGPGMNPTRTGSGIDKRRSPFARITIIADEDGDVFRLPSSDLFPKFAQVYQGIFVQGQGLTGGTVQVDATLVPADQALNPAQDTPETGEQSIWHADTTVAVGNAISKLSCPCPSALRITFAKKGTLLHLVGV